MGEEWDQECKLSWDWSSDCAICQSAVRKAKATIAGVCLLVYMDIFLWVVVA